MMTAKQNNPNITMLDLMAQRLGPELCENMVFVGGAAAGLLITDLALPAIRRTDDIDVVTPTQALEDFHKLENQLRELGFTPDMRPEAPLCRWQIDNMTIDVMPSQPLPIARISELAISVAVEKHGFSGFVTGSFATRPGQPRALARFAPDHSTHR